jgi:hypothetical protein
MTAPRQPLAERVILHLVFWTLIAGIYAVPAYILLAHRN